MNGEWFFDTDSLTQLETSRFLRCNPMRVVCRMCARWKDATPPGALEGWRFE